MKRATYGDWLTEAQRDDLDRASEWWRVPAFWGGWATVALYVAITGWLS